MKHRPLLYPIFFLSVASLLLLGSGCTVMKVVDTAAGAAVGATKTAVKTTGKVVGAAIPDSDKK